MKRHESLIDVEANACNIEEAQKMRQSVREWKEESDIRLVAMEKERTASHFESVLSWLRVDESDQLAIIESISAEAEKYPGTSSWIIENAKVKAWLRPSLDPPLLWIKGSPGTGKSVLAAQLLNFLRTARMLTVCHFCTYSYVSSISYEHILRSLLVQILRRNEELSAYVYNDYFLDKKIPTLRVLEQLLQTCVENLSTMPDKFERVWIVLDGLDECEASTQLRIISTMRHITAKASSSNKVACKVLVSSRMSETISDRLRKSDLVSLAGEKDSLDRSIRQYSNFRLQTLHRKLEQLYVASTDVNDIVEAIVRKADGMFLYARLVLDFISSNIFYEIKEIKQSVNQLPEQLASLFLQDRKSPLLLKESDSVTAHGIAATSCLLSGINVFGPKDDADKRRLRVKQELVLLDDFFNEPMEEVDASLNRMIGQQKLHLYQLLHPNLLNTRIVDLDVPLLPQLVPELEILKQHLRPELVNLLQQQLEELSQFSDYAQQQRLSAQESAQTTALQFGINLANAIGYLHRKLQQKSEYHEQEIGHWRQNLQQVLPYLTGV
ncbi:zinc finger protein [Grosmannia clavigera kw1407]|uniref:Zinc finger protein n=1 Tax=Grosmannia clavigera (strain kw1407 / UAMH 11150) TaxID=655863 RepID=F0XAN4_GROCL|nr:zinc finger protein [Grosmannia clavigera kw1407]EFX05760.1 zinc finger protein [Grosmannia clavigera kw1407]